MEGGELFQRIQDRQDGQDGAFTERGSAYYINITEEKKILNLNQIMHLNANMYQRLSIILQKQQKL